MDTTTQIIHKPLVSILMLTYNRAHFLPEAIRSVLSQSYQDWELIVIDDGSADTTEELMGSYNDPRIVYIRHEENAGLFVRRAESLKYATGVYTAVLDSDDFWVSDKKLEEQVAFLEANTDHVVVGTGALLISETGGATGETHYKNTDDSIRNNILIRNQFVHSSILMRTQALKKTAGYQPTLAEDLELILQLGTLGKFATISGPHTAHRVHENSLNDHGIKMARAVDAIVATHAPKYPHAFSARIFSKLRILRSYLK